MKKNKLNKINKSNKCKKCIYRAPEDTPWLCEYILIVGHRRKCEPGDKCTEYKKGKRINMPTVPLDATYNCKIIKLNN